jgi:hypothetical protein
MNSSLQPHRGEAVLALGILGLVPIIGFIPFGIPAWIMASSDLRGIASGRIDPSGLSKTKAALVCGIVATGLWVIGMILVAIMAGGEAVSIPQR